MNEQELTKVLLHMAERIDRIHTNKMFGVETELMCVAHRSDAIVEARNAIMKGMNNEEVK